MTRLRPFWLCLLLLALAGGRGGAALFGSEDKTFAAAENSFRIGVWDRAERELAQFIEKYPKSERRTAAVLLQAQAQFQQRKYAAAVSLLHAHQAEAGALADQFLFWTGEAELQNTNYPGAAAAFGQLAREFRESPQRLPGAVSEAAARAKLGEWATVTALLKPPDSAFRQAALGRANSEMFTRGLLLLAEAQLVQNHFTEAEQALKEIGAESTPELDWRRRHLLCRTQLAAGRTEEAEVESAGLVTAATATARSDWLAESVAFRADVQARLGRREQALTTLRANLTTNAPVARQRDALGRITALALALGQTAVATETLETYVRQFSNSPAADLALLTLGELQLKQSLAPPDTNRLAAALVNFDRLITMFTNSAYVGPAHLNRGWCYWIAGQYAESAMAFQSAVTALPPSEAQAVARFKLADALFAQKNFGGALEHYHAVGLLASNWPAVSAALKTPALYQSLRASLALTNVAAAETAMRGILAADPHSAEAGGSVLLVAQGWAEARDPAKAQQLFREFGSVFPDSALQAEVGLLVARLAEQQSDWTNALVAYDDWLTRFPTNSPLRAQAEFARALTEARAGNETNALAWFTNFIARFPTNELAARAQWWVATFYWNQLQYQPAETGYKLLFQTWPQSELALEAHMMAGRAAMAWASYGNACEYFTNLASLPDCPDELRAQALFAYGGALLRLPAAVTNKLANVEEARRVFTQIAQLYPTNQQTAWAWGEIGNCALQLATDDAAYYLAASNAYQQAITSPFATVAARSQAKVGLGITLEKMAEQKPAGEKHGLLVLARDQYLDIALDPGAGADLFWQKKAGKKALEVLEVLEDWCAVEKLCGQMQTWLPWAQPSLETSRERARKLCSEKAKPSP